MCLMHPRPLVRPVARSLASPASSKPAAKNPRGPQGGTNSGKEGFVERATVYFPFLSINLKQSTTLHMRSRQKYNNSTERETRSTSITSNTTKWTQTGQGQRPPRSHTHTSQGPSPPSAIGQNNRLPIEPSKQASSLLPVLPWH